jgi:uncharacterized protein (DUF4415 family)
MADKITPQQQIKIKNIEIQKLQQQLKEYRKNIEVLNLDNQELNDKISKINSKDKVSSSKIKRIKEEIRAKQRDNTKQITIRLKIDTIEKLKAEERMYQRLINSILDMWVKE